MRKIIILLLLLLATTANAQYSAIKITLYGLTAQGVGSEVIYNPANNTTCDSVYSSILSTGLYANQKVYVAVKYGYASQSVLALGPHAECPELLTPYQGSVPLGTYQTLYYMSFVGGGVADTTTIAAASGAIPIPANNEGYVALAYSGNGSYTLAQPALSDNWKRLTIFLTAVDSAVITCSSVGFNAKDSSGEIVFGGKHIGDNVELIIYNREYYVLPATNATVN